MSKLFAVILLGLIWSVPMAASATSFSASHDAAAHSGSDMNRNLALVGGGLLGLLLASGAVNLISAGLMISEGTGIAEAMEAGAGLSMPLTVLSAVLGAVFGQEYVLHYINSFRSGEHEGSGH